SQAAVCWSPARGGVWVAPAGGVLRDAAAVDSPQLAAALVAAAGLPLLELPAGVAELMTRHMVSKPRTCSPALARQALLEASHAAAAAASPQPDPDPALRSHAPHLLDYCLSDLHAAQPQQHAAHSSQQHSSQQQQHRGLPAPGTPAAAAAWSSQQAGQLVGLRLLPLLDGTTATLQQQQQLQQPGATAASAGRTLAQHQQQQGGATLFFVPSEEERLLLARTAGLLVDVSGLSPTGQSKLRSLAASRLLNLAQLGPQDMATRVLPRV
ncbi:hypothetical protein Agub_g225, partial [Astrephomene gubernaculifera]